MIDCKLAIATTFPDAVLSVTTRLLNCPPLSSHSRSRGLSSTNSSMCSWVASSDLRPRMRKPTAFISSTKPSRSTASKASESDCKKACERLYNSRNCAPCCFSVRTNSCNRPVSRISSISAAIWLDRAKSISKSSTLKSRLSVPSGEILSKRVSVPTTRSSKTRGTQASEDPSARGSRGARRSSIIIGSPEAATYSAIRCS